MFDFLIIVLIFLFYVLPFVVAIVHLITINIVFKYKNPANRTCRYCNSVQNLFETINGCHWELMDIPPKKCICRKFIKEI